jgi:hypothetical protein
MKNYLAYGFVIALAGALLNLVLYFAGYHSDLEKLGIAQAIGSVWGMVVAITCIVLGIRARRAEVLAANEDFSYGSALGAGVMVAVFAGLFGMATTYLYMDVINPGMKDLLVQNQVQKLEAAGMSADMVAQMETTTRKMMAPPLMAALGFLGAVMSGTIISLIAAAFLKRKISDTPPMVA